MTKQTCPSCKGNGWVDGLARKGTCQRCHGTGTIEEPTTPSYRIPILDSNGEMIALEDHFDTSDTPKVKHNHGDYYRHNDCPRCQLDSNAPTQTESFDQTVTNIFYCKRDAPHLGKGMTINRPCPDPFHRTALEVLEVIRSVVTLTDKGEATILSATEPIIARTNRESRIDELDRIYGKFEIDGSESDLEAYLEARKSALESQTGEQ